MGPTARTGGQRGGGREGTQGQGQGRRGPPETDRTRHGSPVGRAERREAGREAGRFRSRTCIWCGASHQHPTNAGAPHPPPQPPPRPPLQHLPRRQRTRPPPTPKTQAPASPPRAEGGAGADGRCLGGGGGWGAAPAPQAQGPQGEPARGAGWCPALGPGLGHGPGPLGGSGPPPGGGGVRPVELGLLGDHQGDEEPAPRCRAPPEGRGERGGTPRGGGQPRRTTSGYSGRLSGRRGPTGSRTGSPSWRVGRCSALLMPKPTTGSRGPCAKPSPTGATAGGTRHHHSRNPHTSGDTGDGPDGGHGRVEGGECRERPPPGGAGPPDPRPPHSTARQRGARHPPWEGGRGQRAGGGAHCPAAHSPLTADPHRRSQHPPPLPPPPQPASAARRQQGEWGTQARACTRVRLSQGRGRQGKSAPPQSTAGPSGPEPPGRRPAAFSGAASGDRPPPLAPPHRPKSGQRPAGEKAALQPPEGPLRPGGGTPRPRQAQPRAKRPRWTACTLPHWPLPTDNGTAAPRKAQTEQPTQRPAWGRRGSGSGRGSPSPPPPPPPATLTHGGRPGRDRHPRPPRDPDCKSIPQGGAPETKDDRGGGHGPPNGAGGRGAAE